jgi:hypothetical protein
MNTWPSLAGCLLTGRRKDDPSDLHRRQGRRLSLRPSSGRPLLHLPRVLRRPRSLKGSPTRVTSLRYALTTRTKRYGLTWCSTGPRPKLSEACLLLRGQLTCLPSCPRWATRNGKLPAQGENHKLSRGRLEPRNDGKKGGLSASAHGPMVGRWIVAANPISRAKLVA